MEGTIEKMIKTSTDRFWIRFGPEKQSSSFTGNLAGKYLFFSSSRKLLISVAKYEIEDHNFEVAKVSVSPRHDEHVLCLYWKDQSRKYELARRYENVEGIKYRYWKSNSDTREGIYSKQYYFGNEYLND